MAIEVKQPQQGEIGKGVPRDESIPFEVDLKDRISFVNAHIRRHVRKANKYKNTPDEKYHRYIADFFNEEKGALVAEGLIFQSDPRNKSTFTSSIQGETILFEFPDIAESSPPYRTISHIDEVKLPNQIDNPRDVKQLLEGASLPEPINITRQQLIEVGKKIQGINEIERHANKIVDAERIQDFLRLKNHYIDTILLPARQGNLPEDCDIQVHLLKDRKGRVERDRVRIMIIAGKHTFIAKTLPPYNRTDDKGEQMQQQIGEYDFEGEMPSYYKSLRNNARQPLHDFKEHDSK